MEEQRLEAYINLIVALLNSAGGEESAILQAHPDLTDAGLVPVMLDVAEDLRDRGDLDSANRLMNIAGKLLGVYAKLPALSQKKSAPHKGFGRKV
jgi:hypothetical protein